MENQFLIEGLKMALSRGETLNQAMKTFLDAGYSKIEVEKAAKYAQGEAPQFPTPQTPQQQIASNYNQKEPNKLGWALVIILLVIILSGIVVAFFFRQEAINLFNNLF